MSTDLMILPVEGDEASGWKPGKPFVFLSGTSTQQQPRFSPDGRWLAYESDESGSFEISVRPFQRPGGNTTISTGGGTNAVWSRARNELLYLAPDGRDRHCRSLPCTNYEQVTDKAAPARGRGRQA